MRTVKYFMLILSLAFLPVAASDFVSQINNAAEKSEAGRRVIYEMNVGAFTSEGTFQAATAQLSELKSLGIDIVWLMPIYPRGGGINSPYAAKNFQQVNPSYGTISDLKVFVARAHELQMEVWLDWVPNHTATDADWVTEHPEYYKKDNKGQMIHPNNYGDVWQLDYDNANLVNAIEFINTTKLENVPTTERVEPKLSETEMRSMRSRTALKWTIYILAILAAALFVSVLYQVYRIL